MKIGTLQFSPLLGQVETNITTANSLLESAQTIDLLVLPELAFTGYNFPSLAAITPYLEPTTAGRTTQWAIETARHMSCYIVVGYPERATDSHGQSILDESGASFNYNSIVTVSPQGAIVANYRKSFLYYTDETWALEGTTPAVSPSEGGTASPQAPFYSGTFPDLGAVGMGICMDINPHRFSAPWDAYEFARSMLASKVRLVILSMAWLTRLAPAELEIEPASPDMETVAYWLERFHPFVEQQEIEGESAAEILVVFANRCGTEGSATGTVRVEMDDAVDVEQGDRVCYAGSSCVMRFQGGSVRMFEKKTGGVAIMGKSEQGMLMVDTAEVCLLRYRASCVLCCHHSGMLTCCPTFTAGLVLTATQKPHVMAPFVAEGTSDRPCR
nr:protein n-terminal amidase [Quercus suber]